MKKINASVFLLSAFMLAQSAFAQTPPRGPRYNPGGGSSSGPANSGGRSSGPTTAPAPSRGTTNQPSQPGRPTGPRYNPEPNRGGSSSGTIIRPSQPSQPYRGPVVTQPYPNSRRVETTYRPARTYYGTYDYHRPYGYSQVRYVNYYHSPYYSPYAHTVRYQRSYDWYNHVSRIDRNYVYAHWIFYPAAGYSNGYYVLDNYPYYVFNGYRYRYSTQDYCNYQLVDKFDHRLIQTYWNQTCNRGYDICSMERDRMNSQIGEYRYFCSETFRDVSYDYSRPTYDDTSYGSCTDYDNDGYCDDNYYPNY